MQSHAIHEYSKYVMLFLFLFRQGFMNTSTLQENIIFGGFYFQCICMEVSYPKDLVRSNKTPQ